MRDIEGYRDWQEQKAEIRVRGRNDVAGAEGKLVQQRTSHYPKWGGRDEALSSLTHPHSCWGILRDEPSQKPPGKMPSVVQSMGLSLSIENTWGKVKGKNGGEARTEGLTR